MKLQQAQEMTMSLMRHHGLYDYKFQWMRKRKKFNRAGQCNWKNKIIQLQPTFVELNYPVIIKQTILHEIAHALRPRHHHNKFFQRTATALGCVATVSGRHTYYGKEVKKATPAKK